MCLITNQKAPCNAVEPIPCFKVVVKNNDGTYSPFFYPDVVYEIGKFTRYVNAGVKEELKVSGLGEIDYGLHTFKPGVDSIYALYEWCKNQNNRCSKELIGYTSQEFAVLECEIPENTIYFEGRGHVFSDPDELLDQSGYVSEFLYVKRELSQQEIDELPKPDKMPN